MPINYRELLLKYIAHIIEVEGNTFISQTSVTESPVYNCPVFTHEEVVELLNLETETP